RDERRDRQPHVRRRHARVDPRGDERGGGDAVTPMTAINEAGPALSAGPAPAPKARSTARARAQRRKWFEITLFAGPGVLVYLAFVLFPVALAAYYSFFNWNGLGPLDRFIGIDNYIRL